MAEIKITADTRQAESAISALEKALGALSAVLIGGSIGDQFIKLTSAAQEMTNKLIFATGSIEGANAAFGLLANTAKATGSNLGGTVDLFQKLSQSSTLAGSSQESLALITSNFNKTLQISGASGQGAAAALYQFAQAMQKGTLNGDEFRTISETNGYLLKVLEKQTGKTATELRQMASDGQLSAEILARALTEANQISEDYGKTVRTLPQAFENLNTALTVAVKNFNDITGFGDMLVKILDLAANNIGVVIGAIGGLAVAVAAMLIPLIPAATAMAILTGGVAVAGAVAVGAALGYAAQQAGVFGKNVKETNQSQAETNRLAANGLKITHQRNQQALDLDKALTSQIGKLKAANNLDDQATGIRSLQLDVEKALVNEREKYVKTGEKMPANLEKELAIETRRKILNGERLKVDQDILKIKSSTTLLTIQDVAQSQVMSQLESLRLSVTKETYTARKDELAAVINQNVQEAAIKNIRESIRDIDNEISLLTIADVKQREIEAALMSKRNELGSAFTVQLESQYKAKLLQLQADKEAIKLAQEQSDLKIESLIGTSSVSKEVVKLQDLQKSLQQNLTAEQIREEKRRMVAGEIATQMTIDNQKNTIRKTINAELGKYDALIAAETKYNEDRTAIQNIVIANEKSGIELTKQQKAAMKTAELMIDKEYAAAKVAAVQQMNDRILEIESNRIQSVLMQEKSAIAQALKTKDQQVLQDIGANEKQKAIVAERIAFEKKSDLEKFQFGIEQGAAMYSALGAQNKKAFEAAKAFNIANAIMNTYMAATKALATYPPPFNFIAAAAAIGMGFAQVAQIRAQSYSGRALGGPVMGGQSYIVGENGPELFTPNTTGNITRNQDLNNGGVTNINFTIQANDAQGFDDLLMQRRGMITQIVSDAMVERGQRVL